jgi:imidazolonepropionase-like amidohydrolase
VRRSRLVLIILSIGILFEVCPLVPRSNRARAETQQKTPARQLAIRCRQLLDGKSPGSLSDAVIVIEGDRITAVGRGLKIPAGAEVIDLSRATVLPGLIDTHTHLTYHYRDRFNFTEARWQALDQLKNLMANNFRKALAAGVWIVMGSDAVAGLHGENAKELEWMFSCKQMKR